LLVLGKDAALPTIASLSRAPGTQDSQVLETVVYMPAIVRGTQIVRNPTFSPQPTPRYAQADPVPNTLLTLERIAPFPPLPFRHAGTTESYIPMPARPYHQDFYWPGVLVRGIPQKPFRPVDLSEPAIVRRTPDDWMWSGATTRGIPTAALHLPVGLYRGVWDTPMPRPVAQADSYAQPHALNRLVIQPPFFQSTFDLPPLPKSYAIPGLPENNRYAFLPPPTVLLFYTLGEAIQILLDAGFTVDPVVIWKYSATVPYYYVIGQLPDRGTVINYQQIPIQLTVSAGPPPPGQQSVTVPNVVGLPLLTAMMVISEADLNLGTVGYVQSTSIGVNIVTAQTPSAASSVPEFTSINLTVCSGPPYVNPFTQPYVVPDVTGNG
jgi:hypothetical protein